MSAFKPTNNSNKSANIADFESKFDDSAAFSPWGDDDPFVNSGGKGASFAGMDPKKGSSQDAFGTTLNQANPRAAANTGKSNGFLKSSSTQSPWLDDVNSTSFDKTDRYAPFSSASLASTSSIINNGFGDSFCNNSDSSKPFSNSLSAVEKTSTFDSKEAFTGMADIVFQEAATVGGVFGGDSDTGGEMTPSEDPFGTVDPFKDVGLKEDDKFSWDDEPDPFVTDSGIESSNHNNSAENTLNSNLFSNTNKKDPFNVSFDTNRNVTDGTETNSGSVFDRNTSKHGDNENFNVMKLNDESSSLTATNVSVGESFSSNSVTTSSTVTTRSKSVLGDPIANLLSSLPARSKTAMGDPIALDSFDPFAASGNSPTKKSEWVSNEDLLNQNFGGSDFGAQGQQNNSSNGQQDKYKHIFSDFESSFTGAGNARNNNNNSSSGVGGFPSPFPSSFQEATTDRKSSSPFLGSTLATNTSYKSSSSLSNRSSGLLSDFEQVNWPLSSDNEKK